MVTGGTLAGGKAADAFTSTPFLVPRLRMYEIYFHSPFEFIA
jgi:hypothetical protein